MKRVYRDIVSVSILAMTLGIATSPAMAAPASQPGRCARKDMKDGRCPSASEGSGSNSDEIIVTANKRQESVLQVAGAISAFQGDRLLANGATSFKDIAAFTPGLEVNSNTGSGAPIIRGLTQGGDPGATAGIVVNNAPIGQASSLSTGGIDSLDLDPIDFKRIEVLRGPQGTLFGANTLGGLISYTLRDPSLTRVEGILRAEGAATDHGDPSYSLRALISNPLVKDKVGIILSAAFDRRGGFINNEVRDLKHFNSSKTYGLNGSVLFQPNDNTRIMIAGFLQRVRTAGRDSVIYNFSDSTPRDGALEYNDYLFPNYWKNIEVGLATVDQELGFAKLSSVTSLQHFRSKQRVNYTHSPLTLTLAEATPFFGGPSFPTPALLADDSDVGVKKFTQEVRLTSPSDGKFQWMLGGFYMHESVVFNAQLVGTDVNGEPVPAIDPSLAFLSFPRLKEYSAFANATYAFTDDFDVTLGIRHGQMDQQYRQLYSGKSNTSFDLLLTAFGLNPAPLDTGTVRSSQTITTYLATARYHLPGGGIIFARVASGFRPGGPNFRAPGLPDTFNPDTTWNYEVGLKTKFLDNRGTLDLTAYYLDWKNILVSVSSGGLVGLTNGGRARNYGVEAAAHLRPLTGLTLDGTLAYANTKVIEVSPAGEASVGVGDRLPLTPRWSGSLNAEYSHPVTGGWTGIAGAGFHFQGRRETSFASGMLTPRYVLPAYRMLDVFVGLQRNSLEFRLFARNVTNEQAQLAAYTFTNLAEVTVARPRTIGISAAFNY